MMQKNKFKFFLVGAALAGAFYAPGANAQPDSIETGTILAFDRLAQRHNEFSAIGVTIRAEKGNKKITCSFNLKKEFKGASGFNIVKSSMLHTSAVALGGPREIYGTHNYNGYSIQDRSTLIGTEIKLAHAFLESIVCTPEGYPIQPVARELLPPALSAIGVTIIDPRAKSSNASATPKTTDPGTKYKATERGL